MKKFVIAAMPFVILPVFAPVYLVLDNLVLVDIFGCGCVPGAQTNMLNIPFNANDLRLTVFFAFTAFMAVLSVFIAKRFGSKAAKIFYCSAAVLFNLILTFWVQKTFMWS